MQRGCNHSFSSDLQIYHLNIIKPLWKLTQTIPKSPCCQGFEKLWEKRGEIEGAVDEVEND